MGEEQERDWIFTWGFNQGHDNCYTTFHGTFGSARQQMVDHFGDKWGFQYESKEAAGVERYNLKELNRYGEPI